MSADRSCEAHGRVLAAQRKLIALLFDGIDALSYDEVVQILKAMDDLGAALGALDGSAKRKARRAA